MRIWPNGGGGGTWVTPGFHRGMDYLLSPEATLAFIEDLNLTTIE